MPMLAFFRPARWSLFLALLVLAAMASLSLPPRAAYGATFVVRDAGDANNGACALDCTLRDAIIAANATVAHDTITFNIPGSGPHIIAPASPLPAITQPVTIDGFCATCDGATANTAALWQPINAFYRIVITGQLPGAGGTGLHLSSATPSTVRGLVLQFWDDEAVLVQGTTAHVIAGNFIGTTTAGTGIAANGVGVEVTSSSAVRIGGSVPADRNLISGNTIAGIRICGGSANGVQVRGNYIGTRANGQVAMPNGAGVIGCAGADDITIGGTSTSARGNLISGNVGSGVSIVTGSGHEIVGNRIGTIADGTASLGNGASGILFQSVQSSLIGGPFVTSANLISGNQDGITITGSSAITVETNDIGQNGAGSAGIPNSQVGIELSASSNVLIRFNRVVANGTYGVSVFGGDQVDIRSNNIGVLASGSALGNGVAGVLIFGAATNALVGAPGAGNVIGGNLTTGIQVLDAAGPVLIRANRIGENHLGEPAPNGDAGIWIADGTMTTVGGPNPADGNLITNNLGDGVRVTGDLTRVRILGNAIFANGSLPGHLGIDVGGSGPNTNDGLDADVGPNALQNHPVVNGAFSNGVDMAIHVELHSTPSRAFTIEAFGAESCTTNRTDAEVLLGRLSGVATNAAGFLSFDLAGAAVPGINFVVATATDEVEGATSELSPACVPVESAVLIELPGVPASFNLPNTIISPGTSLAFVNRTALPHTATSTTGYFDSENVTGLDVFRFTFDASGTFDYFCEFHPGMIGTVTVTGSNPASEIASIMPSSVFMDSGLHTLTIVGSGFTSLSSAEIDLGGGGVLALPVRFISPGEIEVTVPPAALKAPGTFDLHVDNPAPGGGGESGLFRVIRWPSDVNCDHALTANDLTAALRKLAGFSDGLLPGDCAIDPIVPNADANRDGIESLADALFISRRLADLVEDIE